MLRISVLAAPFLLLSLPAVAVEATQVCPARAGPQHVKQLTALFNDAGNQDPADDLLEVTLTLCAKAGARSAYQVSFDAVAPRFSDADRTGDGKVSRKDFCAETRDGSAALIRGVSTGLGTTVLVRGAGSAPDAVRFSVPVDAVAAGLARDGVTQSRCGPRPGSWPPPCRWPCPTRAGASWPTVCRRPAAATSAPSHRRRPRS